MKTFELTQEQIDQLAEKRHAKELLQKFIPDDFENKPIVGKWYISDRYLIYYLGNNKCNCIKLIDGKWLENIYHSLSGHLKSYRLATEEEVSELLINEAKKRGFKIGAKVKNKFDSEISEINDDNFEYFPQENTLKAKVNSTFYTKRNLFNNGIWAEIIEEEPTKEEINRVLTFLKNQNEQ